MAEKEEAEKKRESQQKQDVEDAKRRKEFQDFEQSCCQKKSIRVRSQCKVQKL
jgi:predicted DNA binding CopG/RHH family protein